MDLFPEVSMPDGARGSAGTGMAPADADRSRHEQPGELDYLCVDDFLKTLVDARALATALELGLIQHLAGRVGSTVDELAGVVAGDAGGLRLLLSLLKSNRVIRERGGEIELSQQFRRALAYRDLLEAKLEFAHVAALDVLDGFTRLIRSPERFGRSARTYRLFCNDRGFQRTPEGLELTRRWMRITTSLTRYEAPVCLLHHGFGRYRRMLDVGGNGGEFALQVCRRHLAVEATVFDLPLVCDIGEEHLRQEPEANRIAFVRGNALTDPLPMGFGLVTFKSMLHDWPEREARRLIVQGSRSLAPGGTLLIFERGPLEFFEGTPPYSMLPLLMFSRAFRSPGIYVEHLWDLGFRDVGVQQVDLETPFQLVTGVRGGESAFPAERER